MMTVDPHGADPADGHRRRPDDASASSWAPRASRPCLIGPDHAPLASGSHDWENQFVDRVWTYSLDAVWAGLQESVAALLADAEAAARRAPDAACGALGISAMMHGYLAFDEADELLVPFRTWRNTTHRAGRRRADASCSATTSRCAGRSRTCVRRSSTPSRTCPQVRVRHHARRLRALAAHRPQGAGRRRRVGHVPDRHRDARLRRADARRRTPGPDLAEPLLPEILLAGQDAGRLTEAGAALLDPTGTLQPGIPLCPPEGDAGTGMVATNSVAPRTGNVSVGTSIFAMVVLEKPLTQVHHELDLVTTPGRRPGRDGALQQRRQRARRVGGRVRSVRHRARAATPSADEVFGALLREALRGDADGGGLLAYNYLSGEPITGLDGGAPAVRADPRQPAHARQLHAHPGLQRVRHAQPGHARPARRGRRARRDVRARRPVPDRGRGAAAARRGGRRAGHRRAAPRARAAPGGSRCSRRTSGAAPSRT